MKKLLLLVLLLSSSKLSAQPIKSVSNKSCAEVTNVILHRIVDTQYFILSEVTQHVIKTERDELGVRLTFNLIPTQSGCIVLGTGWFRYRPNTGILAVNPDEIQAHPKNPYKADSI